MIVVIKCSLTPPSSLGGRFVLGRQEQQLVRHILMGLVQNIDEILSLVPVFGCKQSVGNTYGNQRVKYINLCFKIVLYISIFMDVYLL